MSKRKIPRAHPNARSYKGQSKPFTELDKDNRYGEGDALTRIAHLVCTPQVCSRSSIPARHEKPQLATALANLKPRKIGNLI